MEVLEHLKNPLYLMSQIYNLLDKDGICYIAIPYTKLVKKDSKDKRFSAGNWDNGHVSRWKKQEIIKDMTKLGFRVNIIQQRRRFNNLAFWFPYCWLVLALKKDLH